MLKKTAAFASIFLFVASAASASISPIVRVSGVVRSFDEHSVTIQTSRGLEKLPRKLVPKKIDLRPEKWATIMVSRKDSKQIRLIRRD
jgi:hypothetical protein